MYAIDEAGLRAALHRESREFKRRIFRRDLREIAIGLAAFAGFLICGGMLALGNSEWLASVVDFRIAATSWDGVALFIAAGLWLHYAVYTYAGRKMQERRESRFQSSLLGDLDREIEQTVHQIKMAKNVLWWGLLPVWSAAVLTIVILVRLSGKTSWHLLAIIILLLVGFALDLKCKQKQIKHELLPRRHELESLRAKLISPERSLTSESRS